MSNIELPDWARAILRCPHTGEHLQQRFNRLMKADDTEVARIEQCIVRFPIPSSDENINFYRRVGGAHFYERSAVPFAMSTLDTPVYQAWINDVLPGDTDKIVVDVGGGDGRNAWHCLSRGCRRVVVVDAAGEALVRFRERIAEQNLAWLDRLLLIEADARCLPLRTASADCVIAIEALYYLNEDYELGLKECVRLLSPSAKILISERDYEGGLVLRLLYHGIEGMLQLVNNRSLWDGPPNSLVRTRSFTQSELIEICHTSGLTPLHIGGTALLALLLGYLNGRNLLEPLDKERLPAVIDLLSALRDNGIMRRCHVVVAERNNG